MNRKKTVAVKFGSEYWETTVAETDGGKNAALSAGAAFAV